MSLPLLSIVLAATAAFFGVLLKFRGNFRRVLRRKTVEEQQVVARKQMLDRLDRVLH